MTSWTLGLGSGVCAVGWGGDWRMGSEGRAGKGAEQAATVAGN